MPGITTTRYVIRTTEGTKGPFSPAEIGRLVKDGRLAPTTRILDVDAKRAVTAAEALTAASTEATRSIDFDIIRKAALAAQQGTADISDLNIPASISSEETETVRRPEMAKRAVQLRKKTTEDGLEATEAQPLGDGGLAPAALVRHDERRARRRRLPPRRRAESPCALDSARPPAAGSRSRCQRAPRGARVGAGPAPRSSPPPRSADAASTPVRPGRPSGAPERAARLADRAPHA